VSDSIERIARALDAALPFVRVGTRPGARTVHCGDVVDRAAEDPLAGWRDATLRMLEARYGVPVRPHVAAAFVLQWWCEVAATPIAYAAELGPWVLHGPLGLGFELAPGLYPDRLVLLAGEPGRPGLVVDVAEVEEVRAGRARTAYDEVVEEVVRHFAPDVKMSSRQRWGVVHDTWTTARLRAREAAGLETGPRGWRTSCCFIYALPGCRACATCPRLRRT
jgi:hypothetical protein